MIGDKILEGYPVEDLKLEVERIYGGALLLKGGLIDSYERPIEMDAYYKLVRHVPSNKMFILPLGETLRNNLMNGESKNKGLEYALSSPALKSQAGEECGRGAYPANYFGKVPLRVRLAKTVKPDLMAYKSILDIKDDDVAIKDSECYVYVNSHGAVIAMLPNGRTLGLLPSEFVVVEWHKN